MSRIKFYAVLLGLIFLLTQTEAMKKRKKYNKISKYDIEPNMDETIENFHPIEEGLSEESYDPCMGKCRSGEICQVSEGEAMCICIPECPKESDPRRKVCSNLNSTWDSDCALHQMRCWCRGDDAKCTASREKLSHMHIEYYGECRQHEECTEDQMSDFPRRMRDWLFNVMRDMADRDELSAHFLKMEREAETNLTKRWTNAAIWKFCDLDKSNDRAISRHEIFPIRAPLIALEHCIAPFLDKCDSDSNHKISIYEWAQCLEVEEDDIENKCEELRGEDEDENV